MGEFNVQLVAITEGLLIFAGFLVGFRSGDVQIDQGCFDMNSGFNICVMPFHQVLGRPAAALEAGHGFTIGDVLLLIINNVRRRRMKQDVDDDAPSRRARFEGPNRRVGRDRSNGQVDIKACSTAAQARTAAKCIWGSRATPVAARLPLLGSSQSAADGAIDPMLCRCCSRAPLRVSRTGGSTYKGRRNSQSTQEHQKVQGYLAVAPGLIKECCGRGTPARFQGARAA